MILKELLIINLINKQILKQYTFNTYGLNIILGVKKEENDESNGVGKTAMVESLRYLLGSSIPINFDNNPSLIDRDIFLAIKVITDDKKSLYIGRRIVNKNYGYYLFNDCVELDFNKWNILEDEEYKTFIQDLVITNIKDEVMPTFASLREYLIREEKAGFNDITLFNRNAKGIYKNLAFLSQLPYSFEEEIGKLKELQRNLNKELSIINSIGKEITILKMNEKKIRSEILKLDNILKSMDIAKKYNIDEKKYRESKERINEVQSSIFELEHIKRQYERNISDLESKSQKLQSMTDLQPFYEQIIGYFPNHLVKNYEEVNNFYKFMVENRGEYFNSKIIEIEKKLNILQKEQKELRNIIYNASKILKTTELIDDINNITEEMNSKNEILAEINVKIKMYNQKGQINSKINLIKQQIIEVTEKNEKLFNKYNDLIKKLEGTFDKLVNVAYGEEGILEYEYDNRTTLNATTGRIKIKCSIEDESSHGRLYMKINMFDLSWFLNRIDNNVDIQLLVHDGSYCKPDISVKERLLDYVNEYLLEKQRGQYFITLNIDELHAEKIKTYKAQGYVVAELNRENNHINRFFGFKY